jgi:site-specific recombinase XerD
MKTSWIDFKSPLADGIRAFVAYKRALRRRFDTEERALRLLDRYLCEQKITGVTGITAETLERFLASRRRERPRSYNHLLGVLRRLLDWLVGQEVLDCSPLRTRPRRATAQRIPFLFDIPMAQRLLRIADQLQDNSRALFRGPTYRMIFAILYGLGLRVGEVSRLYRRDVDLDRELLIIRDAKFAKSRLVPFGPRMAQALREYLRQREQRWAAVEPEEPLFSFTKNRPIHPGTISQTFHHLVPQLQLKVAPGCTPPRVHDLRHSFAVGTLLRWYREGINPADHLLNLSTFLGHVDPASTAIYLTITGDLLLEANQRFARFAASIDTQGTRQ